MDKWKVSKENQEKKGKTLLQKLSAILCKEHLVTMIFCFFTFSTSSVFYMLQEPMKRKAIWR